jgi:DNA-binding response OmpR family regulator
VQPILVVDDDPSILKFLGRGLGLEGYEVVSCALGEEAVLLAKTKAPRLVILDWLLPGLCGEDVLLTLREQQPHLPVIILSARDTTLDQIAMLKAGADVILVKPVDFKVLLGYLAAFLDEETVKVARDGFVNPKGYTGHQPTTR